MKSAHERAAYLRRHPTAGNSAARGSMIKKSVDLWKFQKSEGSMRPHRDESVQEKAAAHLMQQQQQQL